MSTTKKKNGFTDEKHYAVDGMLLDVLEKLSDLRGDIWGNYLVSSRESRAADRAWWAVKKLQIMLESDEALNRRKRKTAA